ncbi:MAG TPA: peptidase E [Actinomycetota bacterium]|nr:peptidase E [Actinomycetota bacterium]
MDRPAARQIVAMGGGGFLMDDPVLDRFALGLTGASRPRIAFIPTASGDAASAIVTFFDAFPARSFEPSVLRLFDRHVADLDAFCGDQDLIYVGGGNTAILLAAWRTHGLDAALRTAYDAGVVMAGMSAGANCWFEASTTDSFLMGRADALADGLAFLPGSFTPHYAGEDARRPSLHEHVAAGRLPDGFACDDFAALHLVDGRLSEAVASRAGAGAYRVARGAAGGVTEEPLEVRPLPD